MSLGACSLWFPLGGQVDWPWECLWFCWADICRSCMGLVRVAGVRLGCGWRVGCCCGCGGRFMISGW